MSEQKFKPLEPYEEEYVDYYESNLKDIFAKNLNQRLANIHLLNKRKSQSVTVLSIMAIFITLIIIFPVLADQYALLVSKFNGLMDSYANWRITLNWFFRFLLPKRLIYWSFPQPYTLVILILFGFAIRYLYSVFSLRVPIKDTLFPSIINAKTKFEFNYFNNLPALNYYEALILPIFDKCAFDKISYIGNYEGCDIEFSGIDLILQDERFGLQWSDYNFSGLLLVARIQDDNATIDLEEELGEEGDQEPKVNNQHSIFISNATPDDFNQLIKITEFKEVALTQFHPNQLVCYSNIGDTDELKQITEIAEIIDNGSKTINKYNKVSRFSNWDSWLKDLLRREERLTHNRSVQVSICRGDLFILVPINRELFGTKSVFDPYNYTQDLHFTLASLNLLFKLIDKLKPY